MRLMALACTEMFLTTPLALLQMIIGLTGQPLEPWRSWADTHSNFSRVLLIPSILWRNGGMSVVALEITRWSAPLCALMFFLFFGFAEESRRNYRRVINSILVTCRIKRETTSVSSSSTPSKPWYVSLPLGPDPRLHLSSRLRQLSLPTFSSLQSPPPAYASPPRYFPSNSPSTTADTKSPTTSYSEFEKLPDSPLTGSSSIC